MSSSFIRPEIFQKAGQLSFNVVRIVNRSDSSVYIKPNFITPEGWAQISLMYRDTVVPPNDSISLAFRFKLPTKLSAEIVHTAYFRAYSATNRLLSECSFNVHSEPFHDWELEMPEKRVFFYPRMNITSFNLHLRNKGNTTDTINLKIEQDKKTALAGNIDWAAGRNLILTPYQDTTLKLFIRYTGAKDRVFDIGRLIIKASGAQLESKQFLLVEKYSDVYSPLYIDKFLPHQTDIGFRTFSGNKEVLPFIKARGMTTLGEESRFQYNFNYYSQTGREDLLSNLYYNFTFDWRDLRIGIGAFSSQLGRNLYTRNGIMVSNAIQLSPGFKLEGMVAQSFFIPKTSAGIGATINTKKTSFFGSVAYDFDNDKKVNTTSLMFQSALIPIFKNHDLSFTLYGYHEKHYLNNPYTLQGIAWDLNYLARIGDRVVFRVLNNYGSPDMPGTQMGLFSLSVNPTFRIGNRRNFLSFIYTNASRRYYTYSYEGVKLPEARLYNQYANFLFYFNNNPNHTLYAGPSIEYYQSFRPSTKYDNILEEFTSEKLRVEYKSVIFKNLTFNIKAGVSNNTLKDVEVKTDRRYDVHVLSAYSIASGFGVSMGYDYGPMVNSGLYQFAGDVENHSINAGPTMMKSFFKGRLDFSLFASLSYRFDLDYTAVNVNPRVELFLARDWYLVANGTYNYTQQKYSEQVTTSNSHNYLEFAIRKRWGKTDFNKWQKDTRRLKIILFKDDNGNGQKDDFERGMPNVKTRVKLTNSDNPTVRTEFPVDVTLLSNAAGVSIYNRLPKGFYELSITPMDDVREYFFVDRSLEKIDLTQNTTVYVPFQKASRITGQVVIKRQQFIKKGDELIDLKNIRVTAYNTQGNSYSSFTLEDGSFTIFVPNNSDYFLRIRNVFGDNFRIANNDQVVTVSDNQSPNVVFNVNEAGRQVKFKTAATASADTVAEAMKVKVLHGKIYENTPEQAVDPNAAPGFTMPAVAVTEQSIIPGRFYVVLSEAGTREEAMAYLKIVRENGINGYYGQDEKTGAWFVFTNNYATKAEAQKEVSLLKKPKIRDVRVVRF